MSVFLRNHIKHFLVVNFIVFGLTTFSLAAPITFEFTFTGIQNPSMGVGYITFDDALLPNPGAVDFLLPNPAVLDLSITITGASMGNGTYGLADFGSIAWYTNGGLLDFSEELVGQPTLNDPWGTPSEGDGGDFNLFAMGGGTEGSGTRYPQIPITGQRQLPPTGMWWFTLQTEGGQGDQMVLTSMRSRAAVPTLGTWGLTTLGLLLVVAMVVIRRKSR